MGLFHFKLMRTCYTLKHKNHSNNIAPSSQPESHLQFLDNISKITTMKNKKDSGKSGQSSIHTADTTQKATAKSNNLIISFANIYLFQAITRPGIYNWWHEHHLQHNCPCEMTRSQAHSKKRKNWKQIISLTFGCY